MISLPESNGRKVTDQQHFDDGREVGVTQKAHPPLVHAFGSEFYQEKTKHTESS